MGKKDKKSTRTDDDLKRCWACESCGAVYEGVDPPDKCSQVSGGVACLHEYFENLHDTFCGTWH